MFDIAKGYWHWYRSYGSSNSQELRVNCNDTIIIIVVISVTAEEARLICTQCGPKVPGLRQ